MVILKMMKNLLKFVIQFKVAFKTRNDHIFYMSTLGEIRQLSRRYTKYVNYFLFLLTTSFVLVCAVVRAQRVVTFDDDMYI